MTHRYLRGSWWIQRLAVNVERLMPSPWVMRALVFAARHDGEPELEMLPDLVRRDRWAVDVGAAAGVYTWHLARLAVGCVATRMRASTAGIRRKPTESWATWSICRILGACAEIREYACETEAAPPPLTGTLIQSRQCADTKDRHHQCQEAG